MFGYVRPVKCELKVKEYDYYKAVYCGLCHSLKKRCGSIARFVVNYDFVFVYLLIALVERPEENKVRKKCVVCPKGKQCIDSVVLDSLADISVIMAYLKLRDEIFDNHFFDKFFKGIFPAFLLRKAYKKAASNHAEFNAKVCLLLEELLLLEKRNIRSIDEPADKFAKILSLIAYEFTSEQRILEEIFYHTGRFVYIIDALDDLKTDFSKKTYNPIISKYELSSLSEIDNIRENVIQTLEDSRAAVLRAFDLLGTGNSSNIIKNIIELGMQAAIVRANKKKEN